MLPLRPVETVGWMPPSSWLPCWQRLSRRSLRRDGLGRVIVIDLGVGSSYCLWGDRICLLDRRFCLCCSWAKIEIVIKDG